MSKITRERVKALDMMQIPDRWDLYATDLKAIREYGDSFGGGSLFMIMGICYKLGFERGQRYQKNRIRKRNNRKVDCENVPERKGSPLCGIRKEA